MKQLTTKAVASKELRIGSTLKFIRLTYLQTLKDVAEGTGLSIPFVSDIERGNAQPSLKTIVKLCEHFDIKVSELFIAVEKDYIGKAGELKEIRTSTTEEDYKRSKASLMAAEDEERIRRRILRAGSTMTGGWTTEYMTRDEAEAEEEGTTLTSQGFIRGETMTGAWTDEAMTSSGVAAIEREKLAETARKEVEAKEVEEDRTGYIEEEDEDEDDEEQPRVRWTPNGLEVPF